MSAMDRKLLTRIGKLPAGERLPLSALAREADATVSVVMSAIDALVAAGKLDRETLRPPVSVGRDALMALLARGPVHARTIAARQLRGVADALVAEGVAERCASPNATTNFKNMLRLVAETRAEHGAGALPAPATPAPSATGAAKVGGGDARSEDAAPAERPTGEQLHADLVAEAKRRGVGLERFALGLWPQPKWKLEQLRIAKRPTWQTVKRVRALIAGEPVPPGRGATTTPDMRLPRGERAALGMEPSARMRSEERSLAIAAEKNEQVSILREATDAAHADRRPGESLAEAVKREVEEICARRGAARMIGGRALANLESANGETLANRIARCGREVDAEEADTTTGLARKRDFPAIPADRWTKLAALAGELGKRRSEVLIDVIDAGILCVTEDLREGER